MVCTHERDCSVALDGEPVLSSPENPFSFPGYVPPCSEYLYFDPHSEKDPYSGVSYRDVADRLGVSMHQTADGQPLAITEAGNEFVKAVGVEHFPKCVHTLHSLVARVTDYLYPPDLISQIRENYVRNAGIYRTLLKRFVMIAQGYAPDATIDTSPAHMGRGPIEIGFSGKPEDHSELSVCYLAIGAQSLVFRAKLETGSTGHEFVIKTPSMLALLGYKSLQAVGRIHPFVSDLLRLEALRQHIESLESRGAMQNPIQCSKTLLASPNMLIEEYYPHKAKISTADSDRWRRFNAFDTVVRAYIATLKQSPDDPISKIMQPVVRPDIYTRRIGPLIERCSSMTMTDGNRAGKVFDTYLGHNVATFPNLSGGADQLVCYDPFVTYPLTRPEGVPPNPRTPWRQGRNGLTNLRTLVQVLSE